MLNQIDVGSLIALPIIKTQVEDMFTYIPTNVISITDGQIFLETYFFKSWFRFIINIGLYVNHVSEVRSTWDR
jgi:F-type H+-transporting ATPase subunit alpha